MGILQWWSMNNDIIEIERRNYFGIGPFPVRPIAVTKFIGIPYVASLFYKMKQYFRTFENGLGGRTTNTLYGSIFSKLKDKTDTCLKSGIVYRINCNDCNTKNTISIVKDRQYKWFYQLNLNWWRKKIQKIMKMPEFQKNLFNNMVYLILTRQRLVKKNTKIPHNVQNSQAKVRQSDISVIIRLTMEVLCGVPHNKTYILDALRQSPLVRAHRWTATRSSLIDLIPTSTSPGRNEK
jgi:hypothetical protein